MKFNIYDCPLTAGVVMNVIINVLIAIGTSQAYTLPRNEDNNYVQKETFLQEKWFKQPLNHFDILDLRTFPIRYFEDSTHFIEGGPFVLDIGGEGNLDPNVLRQGQSYEFTKELGGRFFALEHRYYGKSSPFKNLSSDNLVYLSVEQALEDLSNFINTIKNTVPALKYSKVVAFGCSYSASLATWLRYKYPHLVDAVWASSGPLRAVSDFYEYLEVAGEVYSNVSWNCYNKIRKGYSDVKRLLATTSGREEVVKALENWSCGDPIEMNNSLILSNIRYVVADHNIPPDHGVNSCHIFQNVNSSAFQALIFFLKVKSSDVCADEDSSYPNDEMSWLYQTCTEFGFSITMSSVKQPFHDSFSAVDDDLRSCSTEFGDKFNKDLLYKGIDRINRRYGSQDIKVTKVLTVHGAQDPWHKLGLNKETNADAPVIIIPGASHCADQLSQEGEPPQLVEARNKAKSIIKKWIK